MDDDDDMFDDYDDEDYGFEYEDEDEDGDDEDVAIENLYYNSKGNLEDDADEALRGFEQVVSMEVEQQGEKGEWGFKSLKQVVKLHFRHARYDAMMESYRTMLTYIRSAVTRNKSEKVINSILDTISVCNNVELLQTFYETTLAALEDAQNERLWFKTNLKLAHLWFARKDFTKLLKILKQLHTSCQNADGTDNMKKGTQLLEVYALEIQMYTANKDIKRLKSLYERSLRVKSAIPHPRIMGIIHECGGKMHMSEHAWKNAYDDFFQAFKNYDEAGSRRRINCLKYLVLACMLMSSEINPFDAQEAKPYKSDPEIVAMTNLVSAYMNNEIHEFERILRRNKEAIMADEFIRNYIEDLLRNIRTQVLIKLLKPYTRIRLEFISSELNIPVADVESLVVCLILDRRVHGRIDQLNGVLVMDAERSVNVRKYDAMKRWAQQLQLVNSSVQGALASHF